MSTYNVCFCREMRKIICEYPLLSGAMNVIFVWHCLCILIEFCCYAVQIINLKNIHHLFKFINNTDLLAFK